MAIHVSAGNQRGVGLEVFFKALMLFPPSRDKLLTLHADKELLSPTLENLALNWAWIDDGLQVEDHQIRLKRPNSSASESSLEQRSLESAMQACDDEFQNAILCTLPLSKDKLQLGTTGSLGHTEFFRNHYQIPQLTMLFYHPLCSMALLTDHLPLREALDVISLDFVVEKLSYLIETQRKNFILPKFQRILISGINPHAGEKGLLGKCDHIIEKSVESLGQTYPSLEFMVPLPPDTLYFQKQSPLDLLVYPFHDFGLPMFKAKYGLDGLNLTMGLKYCRVSVDHGTADTLFGQDLALYQGCAAMLRFAFENGSDLHH